MRVSIQSPVNYGEGGSNGIIKYVNRLVPALKSSGVESVVLSNAEDDSTVGDVMSFTLSRRPVSLYDRALRKLSHESFRKRQFLRAIHSSLEQGNIDLFQFEDSRGDSLYFPDSLQIPHIVRLHGPWFLNGGVLGLNDADFFLRVRREGRAIYRAFGVTSPSSDTISKVEEYYGKNLLFSACIPNPIEEVSPEWRWSLQRCTPRSILFVGRFDLHKGADIALRAFYELRKLYSDATMMFVGPDRGIRENSGELLNMTEFLSRHFGVSQIPGLQVLGELNESAIAQLRQKCMISIVPSRYETFGNVTLESLAFGMPTICSDVGGGAEIITDGVNGLHFRSESHISLVEKIKLCFDDLNLVQDISVAACKSALLDYSPKRIAAMHIDFYNEVVRRFSVLR